MRTWIILLAAFSLVASAARGHDFEARNSGQSRVAHAFDRALWIQPLDSDTRSKLFSFVAVKWTWPKNSKLKVCWWDPDKTDLKDEIAGYADGVAKDLPVKFAWKVGGAYVNCPPGSPRDFDVRVTLHADPALVLGSDNPTSFFAVVGSEGRHDERLATVNLPLSSGASENKIAHYARHEFCHVLGCLHEHQRGDCEAAFDAEAIKAAKNLSDAQYRAQYLEVADQSMGAKAFSTYDNKSIMMYEFSPALFHQPPPETCVNIGLRPKLSDLDESGLKAAYTKSPQKGLSLEAYLALAETLEEQALLARRKASGFRSREFSLRADASPNFLAKFNASRLAKHAETNEIKANDLERQAKSYRLPPETIEALKAAITLAQAEVAAP